MNGINSSDANGLAIETARRRTAEAQARLQSSDDLIRCSDWGRDRADYGVTSSQRSWAQHTGKQNDNGRTLAHILDLAIDITDADFGNIQIIDSSRRLRIAVNRGFGAEFLDYFAIVESSESACGVALQQNCRVIVTDVRNDSRFSVDSRRIMLRANALAVQSTPLISSCGRLLGMMSTHYSIPTQPPLTELRYLDRLARRTADLLGTTCMEASCAASASTSFAWDR